MSSKSLIFSFVVFLCVSVKCGEGAALWGPEVVLPNIWNIPTPEDLADAVDDIIGAIRYIHDAYQVYVKETIEDIIQLALEWPKEEVPGSAIKTFAENQAGAIGEAIFEVFGRIGNPPGRGLKLY